MQEWDNAAQVELAAHPHAPNCRFQDITGFLKTSLVHIMKDLQSTDRLTSHLKPLVKSDKAVKTSLFLCWNHEVFCFIGILIWIWLDLVIVIVTTQCWTYHLPPYYHIIISYLFVNLYVLFIITLTHHSPPHAATENRLVHRAWAVLWHRNPDRSAPPCGHIMCCPFGNGCHGQGASNLLRSFSGVGRVAETSARANRSTGMCGFIPQRRAHRTPGYVWLDIFDYVTSSAWCSHSSC